MEVTALIFMLRVLVAFSWNLHHFQSFSSSQSENGSISVPDPDLEIRGGSPKEFFQPFQPQFGLKIRGDPGPSPGSAAEFCVSGG